MISPTKGPLPDNAHLSQGKDIHAPGGIIRTRNPNQWAAAVPRVRPRGWKSDIHLLHAVRVTDGRAYRRGEGNRCNFVTFCYEQTIKKVLIFTQ